MTFEYRNQFYTVHGRRKIEHGQAILKARGRSIDTNPGSINGLHAYIIQSNPLNTVYEPIVTREWIAVSYDPTHSALSAKGDSGSLLVVDKADGIGLEAVGLVFGGVDGRHQMGGDNDAHEELWRKELTFVTPIDRVLDWLQNEFGEEFAVGLP